MNKTFEKINKNELTDCEWLIYLEMGKVMEKMAYMDKFSKQLKEDMSLIIKMVNKIKQDIKESKNATT
jgi:hypothetical protein